MQTATVTVQYVNPPKPGKKQGTIKDSNGVMYGAFPDKLALFQKGQTYTIGYEQSEFNGKTYYNVKTVTPAGGAPANNNARGGTYRPTDPVDAERMYVCSLVNAGIQAGHVPFNAAAIEAATNAARTAWASTFGGKTPLGTPRPVSTRNDMDDDIPF